MSFISSVKVAMDRLKDSMDAVFDDYEAAVLIEDALEDIKRALKRLPQIKSIMSDLDVPNIEKLIKEEAL